VCVLQSASAVVLPKGFALGWAIYFISGREATSAGKSARGCFAEAIEHAGTDPIAGGARINQFEWGKHVLDVWTAARPARSCGS